MPAHYKRSYPETKALLIFQRIRQTMNALNTSIRYNFIRHAHQNDFISIDYGPSRENPADELTEKQVNRTKVYSCSMCSPDLNSSLRAPYPIGYDVTSLNRAPQRSTVHLTHVSIQKSE